MLKLRDKIKNIFKPLSQIILSEAEYDVMRELFGKDNKYSVVLAKLDNSFISKLGEELVELDDASEKDRVRSIQIKGILKHYEFRQGVIMDELAKIAKLKQKKERTEAKKEAQKYNTIKSLRDL